MADDVYLELAQTFLYKHAVNVGPRELDAGDLAAFAREIAARTVEPTDADHRRYRNDVLFYNVVNAIVQHVEYNQKHYEVADADAIFRVARELMSLRAEEIRRG